MRLTKKTNDKQCSYDIKKGCLCKSFEKLGQLEDLMEKYEFSSVEELEKVVSDFDKCCQDLINVMGFVAALQSFIESKGLTPESKQFVKKYLESLKKEEK